MQNDGAALTRPEKENLFGSQNAKAIHPVAPRKAHGFGRWCTW